MQCGRRKVNVEQDDNLEATADETSTRLPDSDLRVHAGICRRAGRRASDIEAYRANLTQDEPRLYCLMARRSDANAPPLLHLVTADREEAERRARLLLAGEMPIDDRDH